MNCGWILFQQFSTFFNIVSSTSICIFCLLFVIQRSIYCTSFLHLSCAPGRPRFVFSGGAAERRFQHAHKGQGGGWQLRSKENRGWRGYRWHQAFKLTWVDLRPNRYPPPSGVIKRGLTEKYLENRGFNENMVYWKVSWKNQMPWLKSSIFTADLCVKDPWIPTCQDSPTGPGIISLIPTD